MENQILVNSRHWLSVFWKPKHRMTSHKWALSVANATTFRELTTSMSPCVTCPLIGPLLSNNDLSSLDLPLVRTGCDHQLNHTHWRGSGGSLRFLSLPSRFFQTSPLMSTTGHQSLSGSPRTQGVTVSDHGVNSCCVQLETVAPWFNERVTRGMRAGRGHRWLEPDLVC